ncbi:MAG TPA: hypothetical protein VLK84_24675 [Longimicrobium sp.]|nr:hypothetical protein [Longimicrobium sp.]
MAVIRSIPPILLALGVLAACATGRAVREDDAPPRSPVPAIAPAPVQRALSVCMVEGGQLVQATATLDVTTGDTTWAPPGEPAGTPTGYAAGAPWFIRNEPIIVEGASYVKYGTPRVVPMESLARAGEFGGVPLFTDDPLPRPPEVLYVPARPGCVFQLYMLEPRLNGVRG